MKTVITALMTILFAAPALAAPSISGVGVSGGVVTLSGANFGAKATASPIRFETFSSASNGSKVTAKGWWATKNSDPAYSPTIKTDVHRVPGRNVANLSNDNVTALNMFRNSVGFKDTKKAYVNFWAYLDMTNLQGAPVQIKLMNLLRSTNAVSSDNEYPDQATSLWVDTNGAHRGTLSRYYYGGGSAAQLSYKGATNNNNNVFDQTGWYNIAIQVDQGTLGNADGKTVLWIVGPGYSKYSKSADVANVMQIDGGDYLDSVKLWQYLQHRAEPTTLSQFLTAYGGGYYVGNQVNYTSDGIYANRKAYRCILATGPVGTFSEGPDTDTVHWEKISDSPLIISSTIYADSVYIDNSFARVELCDNIAYVNSTHCEIQPPTAWADGAVTATFNQGSFTEGQAAYFFVVDEAGVVSPASDPYTIGASPAPSPATPRLTGELNGKLRYEIT